MILIYRLAELAYFLASALLGIIVYKSMIIIRRNEK